MRRRWASGARLAALWLAGALAACDGAVDGPVAGDAPPAVRVVQEDDRLWAERPGGGRQLLADDGRAYEAAVSPDGRWIVVDVALFSNLQTTRLLGRDERTGDYQPESELSREVWRRVGEQLGIDVEEVENGRTRFVAWTDDGRGLVLEASGYAPDGADILERVELRLP